MNAKNTRSTLTRSPLTLGVIGVIVTIMLAILGTSWGTAFGGTVPDQNSAPSNLQAVGVSTTEIDLTFSDNSTDEAGFHLERKIGKDGTWAVVATIPANGGPGGTVPCGGTIPCNGNPVISYHDTGLQPGTFYFYRVQAFESVSLFSPYSNEAHASTLSSLVVTKALDDGTDGSLSFEVSQVDATHKVITFAAGITTVTIPSGRGIPSLPSGTSLIATCNTGNGTGPSVTIDTTAANNRGSGLIFGGGAIFHGLIVVGTPLKAFAGGGTILCDNFRSS